MAIAELKEALILLKRLPVLWTPGIAGGLLAAALWVTFNLNGTFFAGRLMIISGLALLVFTTGMLSVIRDNEGNLTALLAGGIKYYFRVLLPLIVIISGVFLVSILFMITFGLFGISDISILTALTIGFMIPTMIVTFFYDTAAIFEERRVFDSIRRSIRLVFSHLNEVIVFLFICLLIFIGIVFALMIVWEAFLFDTLEPISRYNETQLQSFTPEQLITMIGPTGMWITAVILFIGVFLLLPILYSYKACFFKKIAGETSGGTIITQQPTTGEYDSKGRWYKY
jgi:hypothetical protein